MGDKRSHYSATLASLGDMQMVMSGEGGAPGNVYPGYRERSHFHAKASTEIEHRR